MVAHEGDERHEDARGAEAALQPVRLAERGLQRVQLPPVARAGGREALDGGDRVTVRLHREHQARPHRLAVEQHGAGAAHPVLAPDVRAGEPELVTQEVGEEQPRLDGTLLPHAVHGHGDRHLLAHAPAPLLATSETTAPTPRRSLEPTRPGRRGAGRQNEALTYVAAQVPSSTSRTLLARAVGVKGFSMNAVPGSRTPCRATASSA